MATSLAPSTTTSTKRQVQVQVQCTDYYNSAIQQCPSAMQPNTDESTAPGRLFNAEDPGTRGVRVYPYPRVYESGRVDVPRVRYGYGTGKHHRVRVRVG